MMRKIARAPKRLWQELAPLSALWRASSRHVGGLRVYYGLARSSSAAQGVGAVNSKRALLERRFPHHERGFNLMYAIQTRLSPRLATGGKLRGAALVQNLDGVTYPAYHPERWRATNKRLADLYKQADWVLFQSAFARMSAEVFLGPVPDHSEVLHNAVDTAHFTPPSPDSLAERDPAAPVILTAGVHRFAYRLEVPVRALKLLRQDYPQARLRIAGTMGQGSGIREVDGKIQRLVAELGLEDAVTFDGPYTFADAPDMYRRADALVHIQYGDVCPNVVLEAMACGVPVVAQASGGVPELVGPEVGVLIPGGWDWERLIIPTPEEVADALRAVLENRATLRAGARARAVADFGLESWLDRHTALFEELVPGFEPAK